MAGFLILYALGNVETCGDVVVPLPALLQMDILGTCSLILASYAVF